MDQNGNYRDAGDLYSPGEPFDTLVPRIMAHLQREFPDHRLSTNRQTFAGGRKLTVTIVGGPAGLQDKAAREEFEQRVLKEVNRFNHSEGNVLSDYHSTSFYSEVRVDKAYFAEHAAVDPETRVDPRMSLAEFKRRLKPGDHITLVATNSEYAKRNLNVTRKVMQVRSGDFIVEPRIFFDFPKAAAFACDGSRFRISDASEHQPDAFRLYEWTPA